ncbi:hypothetical protein Pcinc_000986 [Petrolisthes cinctipes]|uniref:CRAL-TRIO domain-containing protein n=1 Tax=Petrolisthes cinctipes TaxID=88211 RepID=A0AAE1GP52_PETCI|nr:hypothetical protein Pcinc_000986 [Petrolisthes cinctipes]
MDIHCELGGRWGRHMSGIFPNDELNLEDRMKESSMPLPDKTHAVQQLHALLPTRPDVAFLRTDPPFLLRFLRARKFRVGDAFLLLSHYFEYRQRHRELFRGLNVGNGNGSDGETGIQTALLDGLPGVLAERDPCGRPLIILLASNWDHTKYDVRTVYQAVLLTLEKLVEDEAVQAAGVVAILDWSNFPARLTTSLSPKLLRLMLDGLQDAFPLRLGALHLVNQPWYVEAALGLARPFLKEKLRSRIHVHGNNLATLHAQVPPRLLPAELGGEGGEYHAHTWAFTMLNHTPLTNNAPAADNTQSTNHTPPADNTQSTNLTTTAATNKTPPTPTSPKSLVDIPPSPTQQSPTPDSPAKSIEDFSSVCESPKASNSDSQSTPLVTKNNTTIKTSKSLTSMLFGKTESDNTTNGNVSEGEETALKAH